jgi:hypothetical protein
MKSRRGRPVQLSRRSELLKAELPGGHQAIQRLHNERGSVEGITALSSKEDYEVSAVDATALSQRSLIIEDGKVPGRVG